MDALSAADGVLEALRHAVRARGAPFLGICVGMQLLASRGLEHGVAEGLDWIPGDVERLHPATPGAKVPHVGWNSVRSGPTSPLFAGLPDGVRMYFTHSFALTARDAADVAAWTDHGGTFASAVTHGNVAGVQFHPEKSQAAGLALLANFLEWRP
jgi:glutamine amidotransferase